MAIYHIYRDSTLIASVNATGSQVRAIMTEDRVSMTFKAPDAIDFKKGDTVIVYGKKYKMNRPNSVTRNNDVNGYIYSVEFEAMYYDLSKWNIKTLDATNNYAQTDVYVMSKASVMIDVVVTNANLMSSGYSVGEVDDTDIMQHGYVSTSLLTVLHDLASKYKKEFWFSGIDDKVINFGTRITDSGISVSFGSNNGLYEITREKSEKPYFNRLYVKGGNKNLPQNYGFANLQLPLANRPYLEAPHDGDTVEYTQVFENIYPQRIGTISALGSAFEVFDNSLDFNLNDYLSPEGAKISFVSGYLSAFTFKITEFDNDSKKITFIPINDDPAYPSGVPNAFLKPELGDQFVFLDIFMPPAYVQADEIKLLSVALNALSDGSKEWYNYTIAISQKWLATITHNITLGSTIHIEQPELEINENVRIKKYERDLQDEFLYSFELSDGSDLLGPIGDYVQSQINSEVINRSGILSLDQIKRNQFLNRLSEQNGYLLIGSDKIKAGDSDKWGGHLFDDYLDQPLRKADNVKFASIVADMINSSLYVSGFTGSGYRINPDGSAEFDSLSVRKELNVNVLNIREITGSGGSLAITSVAKILNVTDGGSFWKCDINTDDGTIAVQLRANDIVRCQVWDGKNIKYYSTSVTSVGTDYFNLSKADKVGSGIPEAKDTVFQFGNKTNLNRQGLLYLTNSDTGAPYLDVLDGVNSSDLTGKTKVRLGKLDGINDPDFGQLQGYGLYGENVYLKNGKFKGSITVTGGNAQTIAGSQAQADAAKAYSDSADQLRKTEALAYADGKISAEEALRIASDTATLNAARADATTKANDAITAAQIDAQIKSNAANVAAKVYSDAQDALRKTEALAYADGIVTMEEQARINADTDNLNTAKTDATIKAEAAKIAAQNVASLDSTAKSNAASQAAKDYAAAQDIFKNVEAAAYADGKVSAEEARAIADATAKLNAAKAYADSTALAAVASIKIGGVNNFGSTISIQPYQMQGALYIKNGSYQGYNVTNGIGSTGSPGGNGEIRLQGVISSNGLWTVSGRWISNSNFTALVDISDQGVQSLPVTTAYTDFKFTVNVTRYESNPNIYNFVDFAGIPYVYFVISELKVEKGNQATAWSPLPEDATTDVRVKVNAAQLAAQAYSDSADQLRKTEALAYADGKISAEEALRIASDTATLNAARADATTKANDAITAAQIDAQIKSDAANVAAKVYSDAQDALRKTEVLAYADGKISAEEEARIANDTENLNAAKSDATNKADAARLAAQNVASLDATAKSNAANQAAKDYASAQDILKNVQAAAYADGKVSAEEARAIADATAKLNVAKLYADSTAAAAQNASSSYTDSKSAATIAAAQGYADAAANSKANQAKLDAIAIASTTAQNKADSAQANAALLSQQLVNGIKIGGRNLILNSNLVVENNAYTLKVYNLAMSATAGETYTFSAKLNLSSGQTGIYLNLYDYANYPDIGSIYPDADGIFRKIFIMPAGARHDLIGLYTLPFGNAQMAKAFWVKLEKGNKSTDWTPAPEDVQTAIDLAKSTADVAQLQYDSLTASLATTAFQDITQWAINGKSLLLGGLFNTQLIDVAYLRANFLVAKKMQTGTTGRRIVIDDATNSLKFFNSNNKLAVDLKETDGIVAFNIYDVNGNLVYQLGQNGATSTVVNPSAPTDFRYKAYSSTSRQDAEGQILGNAGQYNGLLYLNDADNKYYMSFSGAYPWSFTDLAQNGFYADGDVSGVRAVIEVVNGVSVL